MMTMMMSILTSAISISLPPALSMHIFLTFLLLLVVGWSMAFRLWSAQSGLDLLFFRGAQDSHGSARFSGKTELRKLEQADGLLIGRHPKTGRLLRYDDYTAGGMMTTEPILLPPDATVADALAHIRNPDLSPALAGQVYIVRAPLETPTGRYIGTCHFQRLLREPPATLVTALLDVALEPIRAETPVGEVARYFATYNLVALPVVDETDHLIGVVTVDDLIDHMLPADWRDRVSDVRASEVEVP